MIKYLITLVIFLLVTGLLWPMLSRFGLGRLPGDRLLASRGQRLGFAFTSSLILSLAATLLFGWVWQRPNPRSNMAVKPSVPSVTARAKNARSAPARTAAYGRR